MYSPRLGNLIWLLARSVHGFVALHEQQQNKSTINSHKILCADLAILRVYIRFDWNTRFLSLAKPVCCTIILNRWSKTASVYTTWFASLMHRNIQFFGGVLNCCPIWLDVSTPKCCSASSASSVLSTTKVPKQNLLSVRFQTHSTKKYILHRSGLLIETVKLVKQLNPLNAARRRLVRFWTWEPPQFLFSSMGSAGHFSILH